MMVNFYKEARKEAISLARERETKGETFANQVLFIIDPRGDEGPIIEALVADEHNIAEARELASKLRFVALTTDNEPVLFCSWRTLESFQLLMSGRGANQDFFRWLEAPLLDGFVRLTMLDSSGRVSFESLPYAAAAEA